jgi:hypothetical protein
VFFHPADRKIEAARHLRQFKRHATGVGLVPANAPQSLAE